MTVKKHLVQKIGDTDKETMVSEPLSKEEEMVAEIIRLLKKYGVKLENDKGYDCVYVANMAKNDYFKSSIADDAHLALFIKDYIDDIDAYEGMPFTRFYADCIGSGNVINWEDML